MKNIIFIFLFVSFPALACRLGIPESYVQTFLNPPVSGHYEKCESKPSEKCHCVEDIDPWTHDFINGELVYNSDKAFAKELADKNAKDAEEAKKSKCKDFSFKGSTIAALKLELNEWKDCR